MSNETQPGTSAAGDRPIEVVVISHTLFFYWWPLWAIGFVLAAASYWGGYQVAFVPPGTEAKPGALPWARACCSNSVWTGQPGSSLPSRS